LSEVENCSDIESNITFHLEEMNFCIIFYFDKFTIEDVTQIYHVKLVLESIFGLKYIIVVLFIQKIYQTSILCPTLS
jgi:hypothetical protein